jgi:hypothetical protein
MTLTYSQTVLRKLLTLYLTHKEQLTVHEQAIAERICTCTLCETLWVRRKRRIPNRCPHCHRTAWNRPILEQIRAIDEAQTQQAANKAEVTK